MSKYQEIGGSRTFRAWNQWEEGEYVAGKYTKTSVDKYGKNNYAITVEETNIDSIEVGTNLVLNANGSLDHKMEEVELKSDIMVEYVGQKTLTEGPFKGKEFHDVKVKVALGGSDESENDDDLDL